MIVILQSTFSFQRGSWGWDLTQPQVDLVFSEEDINWVPANGWSTLSSPSRIAEERERLTLSSGSLWTWWYLPCKLLNPFCSFCNTSILWLRLKYLLLCSCWDTGWKSLHVKCGWTLLSIQWRVNSSGVNSWEEWSKNAPRSESHDPQSVYNSIWKTL